MNTPNDTQIQSTVSRDISWAQHHLFLLATVVLLTVGSVYAVLNLIAKSAHDTRVADQAILAQMQKQNEATQASNKAQIDALTAQNAQILQQFQAVMASVNARDAQLVKDRQEVKTLPPSQLATKWGASANESAPVILPNGDFDAPLALAQKSTDALIQVPVLSKDVTDLKSALDLSQQTASNNQKKFEDEQTAHKSDNAVCTQNIKTLNDKVQEVKDNARKNNIIFLAIGWIAKTIIGSKLP